MSVLKRRFSPPSAIIAARQLFKLNSSATSNRLPLLSFLLSVLVVIVVASVKTVELTTSVLTQGTMIRSRRFMVSTKLRVPHMSAWIADLLDGIRGGHRGEQARSYEGRRERYGFGIANVEDRSIRRDLHSLKKH